MKRYKIHKIFISSLVSTGLLLVPLTSCTPSVREPNIFDYGIIKNVSIENTDNTEIFTNHFWNWFELGIVNRHKGGNLIKFQEADDYGKFDNLECAASIGTWAEFYKREFQFSFQIEFSHTSKNDGLWNWISSPTFDIFSPAVLKLNMDLYKKGENLEPQPGQSRQNLCFISNDKSGKKVDKFIITPDVKPNAVEWNIKWTTNLEKIKQSDNITQDWGDQKIVNRFNFDDVNKSFLIDNQGNTWGFKYDQDIPRPNKYFWYKFLDWS